MLSLTLRDRSDTTRLAIACAATMQTGDVLLLEGELGAGKTAFVAALGEELGAVEPARSPTYTIGHMYECAGGTRLAHLDLYRTTGIDDSSWGDIEPYFEEGTWAAVEWPGAIVRWLGERATWSLNLSHAGGERRLVQMTLPRRPGLLPQFLEAWA